MGRVIPDTQGESIVIWVVGILLTHGGINVVWISVRPRLDGLAACSTYESETLCHGFLFLSRDVEVKLKILLPVGATRLVSFLR